MSASGQTSAATAQRKVDPESLVLRGSPRPAVRFRRGLIIGLTAAVAAAVIAVTWVALEPPAFRPAADHDEAELPREATPEALARAPGSYGEIPRLGPPLPGDLGRPILEQQRMEAGGLPGGEAGASEAERARAAAEAERGRLVAARDAARSSGVLVQLPGPTAGPAPTRVPAPQPVIADGEGTPGSPDGRGRRSEFGPSEVADMNPHPLRAAPSPWTLSAGTIIPASLITGLNSDLPGTVLAQVTEPVRDSATGRNILIPQGARLIGSYDSAVGYGQRRALLVWQRITFPDGSSVRLDNMPATDASGYAGVEDRVDFHTWRLLQGIALSTLLGVGTELSLGSDESELVEALREGAQQNAARAGDRITARNLDIAPTLRVRPGWPVRAIVHKDLVLRPWRG